MMISVRICIGAATLFVASIFSGFCVAAEIDKGVPTPCSSTQKSDPNSTIPKADLSDEVCESHKHTDCEKNNTCDLEEFGFWVKHFQRKVKKMYTEEPEEGSMIYAWYKTASTATLENYIFVQQVRGCSWNVMYYEGKAEANFLDIEHNGKVEAFCFPEWEIDMVGKDPSYTSEPNDSLSRHFYAQWTERPYDFPTRATKLYGEEKPTFPLLGMVDSPTRAYVRKWGNGRVLAHNTALEFHTCLYRKEDVPATLDPIKDIVGVPIGCFDWKSMHVYDPTLGRMTSPDVLPKICTRPKKALVPFAINP